MREAEAGEEELSAGPAALLGAVRRARLKPEAEEGGEAVSWQAESCRRGKFPSFC